MSLERKLIQPESILIEKTALDMAAAFYEKGRSLGLSSKYKGPKEWAKKHVERFIPLAVDLLMDMLANPATPKEQKDAIYDAFLERTNDVDLSNVGIKAFENPLAKSFISDKVPERKPVIWNTQSIESLLDNDLMKKIGEQDNGKEN